MHPETIRAAMTLASSHPDVRECAQTRIYRDTPAFSSHHLTCWPQVTRVHPTLGGLKEHVAGYVLTGAMDLVVFDTGQCASFASPYSHRSIRPSISEGTIKKWLDDYLTALLTAAGLEGRRFDSIYDQLIDEVTSGVLGDGRPSKRTEREISRRLKELM